MQYSFVGCWASRGNLVVWGFPCFTVVPVAVADYGVHRVICFSVDLLQHPCMPLWLAVLQSTLRSSTHRLSGKSTMCTSAWFFDVSVERQTVRSSSVRNFGGGGWHGIVLHIHLSRNLLPDVLFLPQLCVFALGAGRDDRQSRLAVELSEILRHILLAAHTRLDNGTRQLLSNIPCAESSRAVSAQV